MARVSAAAATAAALLVLAASASAQLRSVHGYGLSLAPRSGWVGHVLPGEINAIASEGAIVQLGEAEPFPPPSSQGLRPANGYAWLCDGASASNCPAGAVPARLRRPLHLPRLAAGASCPTATARRVSPSYGVALGPGPAYPVPFSGGTLSYDHGRSAGGWVYVKVLSVLA